MSGMRHKQLMEQQDQQLDEITSIAHRLRNHAEDINVEIEHQGVMINKTTKGVDETDQKMNFVNRKLAKLLKTSDKGTICTICILTVILIGLLFLVMYT